jgi:hypothetical protein
VNGGLLSQIEVPLYGSSRLGVWRPDREVETTGWELFDTDPMTGTGGGIAGGWERGRVQFELSNHLGNVLVTISDVRIPVLMPEGIELCDDPVHPACYRPIDYYLPQILSANDYYPGGMDMPLRRYAQVATYRYGYQGDFSEKGEIKGQYLFELRNYDARIVRWTSVDPNYQGNSPYEGMGNQWPNVVDPDGGYFFGLFGSTSTQRRAAKTFQKEHGGKIKDYNKRTIHVQYSVWQDESDLSFNLAKQNDPTRLRGFVSQGYRAHFDRKNGDAIVDEWYNQITKQWSVIPQLNNYNPDFWDKWSTSENWFGKATYNIADALWVTGQVFIPGVDETHIGGEPVTQSQKTDAFVGSVSTLMPTSQAGKLPGVLRYLKNGGPAFDKALKSRFWQRLGGRPAVRVLTNSETGQVYKVYGEIHHRFIPQRWNWPNWITNSRLNLQATNAIEHAVKDSYRYQFMPKWVKEMIDNGSLKGIYY